MKLKAGIFFFIMFVTTSAFSQSTTDSVKLSTKTNQTTFSIDNNIPKKTIIIKNDSLEQAKTFNVVKKIDSVSTWKPNPQQSIWFSVLIPGWGQFYNKKYWKIPIIYGGFAGIAYAISLNQKYYDSYSKAYRDFIDSNPNTNSYLNILPSSVASSPQWATSVLKNRTNSFRRYRDLSIIIGVGFYALQVIDAFVDAQLYTFDISPDLSMNIQPSLMTTAADYHSVTLGGSLNINF